MQSSSGDRVVGLIGSRAARWSVVIVICGMLFADPALGQEGSKSAPLLLRIQAGKIIEEAWPQLADSTKTGEIGLMVEGASARRLIENAIIEFLARRGVHPEIGERSSQLLATVLEQTVEYRLLPGGESLREVRTAMEFRLTSGSNGTIRYAGPFYQKDVDTVAVRDDAGLLELRSTEGHSFVEKVLGPVLLVGGAFLVIYLFFTVRN